MGLLEALRLRRPNLSLPQPANPDSSRGGLYVVRPDGTVAKASFSDIQQARTTGLDTAFGVGDSWAPTHYGSFMAQSVPAYRAIMARVNAVRSAPLRAMRRRANDMPEELPEVNPIQRLVTRVNPWWTSGDLVAATEMYLCLWGSAYWYIEKQGSTPIAIWPLRPDRVRVVPSRGNQARGDDYIAGFLFEANGKTVPLLREEVVWFRYINPLDEYAGLSPIAPARLTLEMGRNALLFNTGFFKNNGTPSGLVFTTEGPLGEDESNEFYERLEQRYKNPQDRHLPMLIDLSKMGKPENLGVTQKEMEFLETLNFTIEDAARIWGVPPPYMMSQKTSTYNNVREARIQFYISTISEEWAFLEAEMNEMLMPMFGEEFSVHFDTSQILPLKEARAELDKNDREAVLMGGMTINEYRTARSLPPVAWGDVWWPTQNTQPISSDEGPPIPDPFGGLLDEPTDDEDDAKSMRRKAYSEEFLTRIADAFGKQLENRERPLLAAQRDLFEKQRRDVLRRLRAARGAEDVVTKQPIILGVLFDANEWTDAFASAKDKLVASILIQAAQEHGGLFGLGDFDAQAPNIRTWVDDRVRFWASRENEETGKLLTEEIQEAIRLGEGIPEIEARVEQVFRFNDAVRAERIARTESLGASNQGHLEMYRQSGVVDDKMWLTAVDGRERPDHRAAHRQTVPVDAKFLVGGESLDAPGIGGSPAQIVNCRCAVAPVIRKRSLIARPKAPATAAHTNGHGKARAMRIEWEDGLPKRVVREDADAAS